MAHRHGPALHRRRHPRLRPTPPSRGQNTIRCLKRYIAREVYQLLTNPNPATDTTSNLRALRQHAGATLQHAADCLNTWPSTISRIEHGTTPNHHLVTAYRDWLNTLTPAA